MSGEADVARDLPQAVLDLDTDEERRRFFALHKPLASVAIVESLCREAASRTAAGPAEATSVVRTALWLSGHLGDDRAQGLSLRAEANLRLYTRDARGALDGYKAALAAFERARDDLGAAITRSIALGSLNQLGEFELAERWAAEARPVLEARGDQLRLARLEFNLGQLYSRQDRFREALDRYRWACEQFRIHGEPRDVGAALRNLAVCHQDLNDFESALETYQEAAGYCREHGLTLLGLEVDYNIAYLHFMQGEYTRALRAFDAARRSSREHDDPHHRALADLDQAEIYLELNMLGEAEALAIDAGKGFAALGMRYEVAKSLTYQAMAAARCGRRREALERLDGAQAIFERQANRIWSAVIDFYRAAVLRSAGDIEGAVAAARTALDGFSSEVVPARMAACEILLARLALDGGDPRGAVAHVGAALERLERAGRPALELQAHLVAGQAWELVGNGATASAAYRRAEDLMERLRGFLLTDELKIAFTRDKEAVHQGLVRLTLSAGSSPGRLAAAFAVIERAKSRALADLLAFRGSEATSEGADAQEVTKLRRELNWRYRQLDREELAGDERARQRRERRSQQIRSLELTLQRAVRQLQTTATGPPSVGNEPTIDLETLRAALPPATLMIEYFVAGDAVLACLVGPDVLRIETVCAAPTVDRLYRSLKLQLGKFGLPAPLRERHAKGADAQIRRVLGELYRELIAPLRADLDCAQLLLVPHGILHSLPFHALHDGARYLIDEFCFTYAPSATVYELCRARSGPPGIGSLVFGVPDERAPLIAAEAHAVAEELPRSQLFLGAQANRDNLVRHGAHCRILHLATHGLFRSDNPMFSAIQLGDDRLSLFDLYELRLHAELAVLSGCGTGLGAVVGADELVGLTRGLLHAGARSLVATLWDVNDESTTELMRTFYRGLAGSSRTAEQLRQAQLTLRQRFPNPYYWAPFVLLGRPEMTGGSAGAL